MQAPPRNVLTVIAAVVLTAVVFSPVASKQKQRSKTWFYSAPYDEKLPADLAGSLSTPLRAAAAADTFVLAWFPFDTPTGAPDPQGWTSVDLTAQVDEFFHVADGSELDGGQFGTLLPLEGAQSVWCGADASTDPVFCQYATLPGYGNNWEQFFVSKVFECDSIRLHYKVQWDAEPEYDFAYVEYYDAASFNWVALPVDGGEFFYNDEGALVESFGFATTNKRTQIRFRFDSDGAYSDEDGIRPSDGALLVDSITVECYTGVLLDTTYFEDFEDEAPGDRATTDGCWFVQSAPSAGNFAAMHRGGDVLQEDRCFLNKRTMWGFFTSPIFANYDCHLPDPRPDQGVVPFITSDGIYINNEIWSPKIAVTGAGSEFLLSFRVYRDLPLDNLVFYNWKVRSWVAGCPGDWQDFGSGANGGAQRDFFLNVSDVSSFIEPGATDVQIALQARDFCDVWCNIFGSGACHSHAPLFDDVRLVRVNTMGPQYNVQHHNLFQDNFAEDGTVTGTARADAAVDIAPSSSPMILPGDSLVITVSDPNEPLANDPLSGVGPAVYAYVAVQPFNQPGKSGADLEAPETRNAVKRYPLVDSLTHDGAKWYCFRMDSVETSPGFVLQDRYCFDLDDAVLTPGDTVHYFFKSTNLSNQSRYFSRKLGVPGGRLALGDLKGQGENFATGSILDVLESPMEFTILPAGGWRRGGDMLYVDDADDRGGAVPIQLFMSFDLLGIWDLVDRYDVLAPSSMVSNSLASRVKNVTDQIIDVYETIIWNTASLSSGLIGDGTGNPEKSDDFGLLLRYIAQHTGRPGLFLTGDNIAEEWVTLSGAGAINLRSAYLNFNLLSGDHVGLGEGISPTLVGTPGGVFGHGGSPDHFIAYGGCPVVNDFDVLAPTGSSVAQLINQAGGGGAYAISQRTNILAGDTATVFLMGFSLHHAHDVTPRWPVARVEMLRDILIFLGNALPSSASTGIGPLAGLGNRLDHNYPNPFNPTTTIHYGIRTKGHVSLRIYNAAGQLVRTLVNEVQSPDRVRPVTWDGRSDAGNPVSSGVYFYRLVTTGFSDTKKMVFLK